MERRDYTFVADTDSLEALRRLRRGWAGWELAEGEFRVRLREGGAVRLHVDRAEIETGFEVSCLVADYMPGESALPTRDSAFTSDANEITVFRGITWLERLPDAGPDHTVQFSGIPGFEIPDRAVAKADFTDAVGISTEGSAIVIRLALRPGWLEMVGDPDEVALFFSLRGFT